MSGSLLEALVKGELISVTFFQEWVEFDFHEARLLVWVWPAVVVDGVRRQVGEQGYRDGLCAFLRCGVVSVEESRTAGLVVRFARGEIVVKPVADDLQGPEIALFTLNETPLRDRALMVWRSGEGVFEGI